MFSGWGVRTLSSAHSFYDPLSYHRGSVWPVEQATIVFGLRRFGFDAQARDLATAMFDLARLYPDYRIPECVGGYARSEHDTLRVIRQPPPESRSATVWDRFTALVDTVRHWSFAIRDSRST